MDNLSASGGQWGAGARLYRVVVNAMMLSLPCSCAKGCDLGKRLSSTLPLLFSLSTTPAVEGLGFMRLHTPFCSRAFASVYSTSVTGLAKDCAAR